MRFIRLRLFTAITCAALGVLSNSAANAQSYKVEGGKPTYDDLSSPRLEGGNSKSFNAKNWLEMEASLKVLMSPVPPSQTAERILVKWYVAVEHPEKKGAYLLLTKDVTLVNVPLNEETFTSVYLSPASLKRLTGTDNGGKRAVYLVGYEVLVNGVKVAQESTKSPQGKTDWWNVASDKISRNDTVPLLDKTETPFASMWWDRYAEISKDKN